MVNWKDLKSLRVIAKIQEILVKWYDIDILFIDNHCKIDRGTDKNHSYKNSFLNAQLNQSSAYKYFTQDIENIFEQIQKNDQKTIEIKSGLPHINMIASEIVIDGQFMGYILAYPFLSESISDQEVEEIKEKASEANMDIATVDRIKKLNNMQKEYLQEFLEILTNEIVTYHTEITKREERILDLNNKLEGKFTYHNMIGKSKP
ncbi:MAG: hypothetical protein OXB84_00140, partial [Halobacteriovoraceae bacterium]|nr:hypothetical protein [Halobacteriovoraceae bacterium]